MFSKRANVFLRLGISLGLLFFFFKTVEWGLVFSMLKQADHALLLIPLILINLSIFISAFKWQLILKTMGHSVSLRYLIKLYYEGTFLNNFLPTNIGGDGYKYLQLAKMIESRKVAAASIVSDRLSGFFVLILLLLFAATLFSIYFFETMRLLTKSHHLFFFGILSAVISVAAVFAMRSRLTNIRDKYFGTGTIINRTTISIALIFYGMAIMGNYFTGKAYGLDINLVYYFIFMPMILVLLFLPISFNGVGVREVAFITFFGLVGVTKEQGFLIALTPYLMLLLSSGCGGVLLLKSKS